MLRFHPPAAVAAATLAAALLFNLPRRDLGAIGAARATQIAPIFETVQRQRLAEPGDDQLQLPAFGPIESAEGDETALSPPTSVVKVHFHYHRVLANLADVPLS